MDRTSFEKKISELQVQIQNIKSTAHKVHRDVNQFYDKNKPYSYHLDMVAQNAIKYASLIIENEEDILPVLFGAWFHDSIEDARLTYNDVMKIATELGLNPKQAYLATEIVYALTNDKGRTRNERAGEKYYKGIRETPYAPFVKMCDRLANTQYSFLGNLSQKKMADVYKKEMPLFLKKIQSENEDISFQIPQEMIEDILSIIQ